MVTIFSMKMGLTRSPPLAKTAKAAVNSGMETPEVPRAIERSLLIGDSIPKLLNEFKRIPDADVFKDFDRDDISRMG